MLAKDATYSRLRRLGVNIDRLKQLDPTEEQLESLVARLARLRDRQLVRFISSVIGNSLLDERPCQQEQVALALPYPPDGIGEPLAAVRYVFCHRDLVCDQLQL